MTSERTSAVAPDFFESFRDVEDLYAEFGPANGRFVAMLPNKWIELARHWADELADANQHARIVRRLRAIKEEGYLVATRPEVDDTSDWPKTVSDQIAAGRHFEFTIGPYLDQGGLQAWEDVLPIVRDKRVRSKLIKGSTTSLLKTCFELIQSANTIYLIDPYLSLERTQHRELIGEVLNRIKYTKCTKVSCISRADGADFGVNDLKQNFPELPRNVHLHWHRFTKRALELHDRYFLTDKGAVSLGKGFAETSDKSMQIAFVDRPNHKELVERYIRNFDLKSKTRYDPEFFVETYRRPA